MNWLCSTRLRAKSSAASWTFRWRRFRRDWLANTGYDPAYGARPLRRLVQTEVGDQLARMLLAGEVHDGDTVLVDQTGGDHLELSSWAPGQIDDDFSAEAK